MVILCYHKVAPATEGGRRLNIEPKRLAKHIRYYQRRRFLFWTAADLVNPWPHPAVVLTFDDAYTSTLTNGIQTMTSLDVRASIYAVTDCVGGVSSWDVGNETELADWDLLRAAQDLGFEIGNHTDAHAFLGRLPAEKQAAHITRAHEKLVAEGIKPGSFCFPYGSLNEDSARAVRLADYTVGLALGKRNPRASDDLARLPRIVLAYSDGLAGLIYKTRIKPKLYRLIGRA